MLAGFSTVRDEADTSDVLTAAVFTSRRVQPLLRSSRGRTTLPFRQRDGGWSGGRSARMRHSVALPSLAKVPKQLGGPRTDLTTARIARNQILESSILSSLASPRNI